MGQDGGQLSFLHIPVLGSHAEPARKVCLSANGPAASAGLRIAFLTDFHLSRHNSAERLRALFAEVTASTPDLILLGGDASETFDGVKEFFSCCRALHAPLGVFAVPGNNDKDRYGSNFPLMRDLAARNGVHLLVDEQAVVRTPRGRVLLAGLDERYYGNARIRHMFRGTREGDLRILLSHYPDCIAKALREASAMPHLVLCGHTHGGQWELFGKTVYDLGYSAGHTRKDPYFFTWGEKRFDAGFTMVVSAGLGESKLPLRINVPREYHIIDIVSEEVPSSLSGRG